ncbi:MAG: histone deacetylase [Spirochaetales bacterium]
METTRFNRRQKSVELTVFRDNMFERHEQPEGHPERPERIRTMYRTLDTSAFRDLLIEGASRDASEEQLRRVHSPEYIEAVARTSDSPYTFFDSDTSANQYSYAAARRASGCAVAAVDSVLDSTRTRALVVSRPPGHHAEAGAAAGFCFFNHIMVAALHARARGVARVFVLDWDVHHGNGTFHSSYERSDVFYASLHQFPHFPGTGKLGEIGAGDGTGTTLTVPLPAGCDTDDYLYLMQDLVAPAIRWYEPELILVSAGFDAHYQDPLAGMHLTSSAFGSFAKIETELADEVCDGRIVYLTEGGYHLPALGESLWELVNVLTGSPAATEGETPAHERVQDIARQVHEAHGGVW